VVILLAGSLTLVAYVFAGYPAVAALLARLCPRPVHAHAGFTPKISLIILAYNEQDVIEAKLRNVAELDYPPERLEVLVVTDGSDDGTAERAGRTPGVSVLHRPERRGKLAAINRGVEASTGEVLVFSDANNLYSLNAIRELVRPLSDPAVGLVTGRKAIEAEGGSALDQVEGLYWRYESKIKEWESASGSVVGVAGEILAFRREAYRSPPARAVRAAGRLRRAGLGDHRGRGGAPGPDHHRPRAGVAAVATGLASQPSAACVAGHLAQGTAPAGAVGAALRRGEQPPTCPKPILGSSPARPPGPLLWCRRARMAQRAHRTPQPLDVPAVLLLSHERGHPEGSTRLRGRPAGGRLGEGPARLTAAGAGRDG
jgi:hypothetical protein